MAKDVFMINVLVLSVKANKKEERQCTFTLTMRRFHIIVVAAEE